MTTLERIRTRFSLPVEPGSLPVEIPGVGRDILPILFAEWGFCRGAEIGVFAGEFSLKLCEANPALHLTCVDPWQVYPGYRDYVFQHRVAEAERLARQRLLPYGCTLLKQFSVNAAATVPNGSLDFVYLDGNHAFDHVMADVIAWVPKVRKDGIIAGHDYKHFRRQRGIRVVEAVNAYTLAHDIDPWFVLGRTKTRRREVRDGERSYLWVNP